MTGLSPLGLIRAIYVLLAHRRADQPPGPAGACHRIGKRPDPVGRPDDNLSVIRYSREGGGLCFS